MDRFTLPAIAFLLVACLVPAALGEAGAAQHNAGNVASLVASSVPRASFLSSHPLHSSLAFTPHAPIYINGDSGFNSSNGVTGGNGTQGNPYIIEGWEICNVNTSSHIEIRSTSAYFTIRNCYVHNGSNVLGIALYYASNGNVLNNTARDWFYRGIYVLQSSHVHVINNTVENSQEGIWVHTNANDNVIAHNSACSNDYDGIVLGSLSRNTVSNNYISQNSRWGMMVHYANSNTILGNIIVKNARGGIEVNEASNNNKIYRNDFIDNNGAGPSYSSAHIQANDTSYSKNFWNSSTVGGNYWSDWTGPDGNGDGYVDSPYVLGGGRGGKDNLPLVSSAMVNEPPALPLLGIAFLLPAVVAIMRRKTAGTHISKTRT